MKKITFTGSTRVGKLLMAQSSNTVKRVSMELGGNAPFIVFDDANIDKAVSGAVSSKFRGCGQVCVSPNRFFIHEKVYDEFCEKFTKAVSSLRVGNGVEEGVSIGPLINKEAVERLERQVASAVSQGAVIEIGGERERALGENFFSPTVLSNVTSDMIFTKEEIFGPVAPLIRFSDEEDVVNLANGTPAGLAGYFYTENISRAFRVGESLEFGMVGVNEPMVSNFLVPFGGVKESGMGREGSKYGIEDYINIKLMCFGNV